MPRLQHFDHDGRARFITFSTYRRAPVLSNAKFQSLVVESVGAARVKHGFKLLAYVVMPEHMHLVLWPPEHLKRAPVIGELKRLSSLRIHSLLDPHSTMASRLLHIQGGRVVFQLWQLRCYDHNCRTEQAVWQKVNYCHWNPVKRGLVKNPEDWVWSSYRSYQGLSESPIQIDGLVAREEEHKEAQRGRAL